AKAEAGDLIAAATSETWSWRDAVELSDLLGAGARAERGPGHAVFKSVGHAMFDLAAARVAFPRCGSPGASRDDAPGGRRGGGTSWDGRHRSGRCRHPPGVAWPDVEGRRWDRNFWLGVSNGVFVNGGEAFFNSSLVLAPFLAALGTSPVVIGLIPAMR